MTALLLLIGCFSQHGRIQAGLALEQHDATAAEQHWRENVEQQPLLRAEWRRSLQRLCQLREARVREGWSEDADVASVRAARLELRGCPGLELQQELDTLEAVRVDATVHAILPDDAVPTVQQLRAVREIDPYVTEGSSARKTIDAARDRWRAAVQRLAADHPPAVTALLADVAGLVDGPPTSLQQHVAHQLEPAITASLTVTDTCSSLPPFALDGANGGLPVMARLEVEDCRTSTRMEEIDVPYEVTRYRTEIQRVKKVRTISVEEPVYQHRCSDYAVPGGVRTVCGDYLSYTRTRTTRHEVWVDEAVQVPYTEVEVRRERRHQREDNAVVLLWAETPHGAWGPERMEVASLLDGDAPIDAAAGRDALVAEVVARSTEAIRGVAAELRRSAWRAAASPDTPEGREALSALLGAGEPPDDVTAVELATQLGIDPDAVGLEDLGPVAYLSVHDAPSPGWQSPQDVSTPLTYPFMLLSYGLRHGSTNASYAAHASPAALDLDIRTQLNASFTTGRGLNGLGTHLTMELGFGFGRSLSPRYAYPRGESDEGPGWGWHGRGAVGAMLGGRGDAAGLFVGLRPHAGGGTMGATRYGMHGVPVLVRLELRPTPRQPLLLHAWYGDLLRSDSRDRGAELHIPLNPPQSMKTFATLTYSEQQARTELPGVERSVRVVGGRPTYRFLGAGISISLF